MRVRLTFKTPDVLVGIPKGLSEEDLEQLHRLIGRFVKDGEYVRVEFNTQEGTCRIVPNVES